MLGPLNFEGFVRDHSTTLFRSAFLLTGSHAGAEELVQDTLVMLYPKWRLVEASDVPMAYVRRSMANRYVSGLRSRAGREISVWELPDRWDGSDLSQGVEDRQLSWQLLGGLPRRQRAAVVLRYFHGVPDAEIAEALGCRIGTVRSLISRAIAAMRIATTTRLTGPEEASR